MVNPILSLLSFFLPPGASPAELGILVSHAQILHF